MTSTQKGPFITDPVEKMVFALTGMTSDERKRCKARSIKFPPKLMYVLECEDYEDAIAWEPSGLSFVIIDPKAFENRVLPEIFKEAKYSSFQRKLMRWSFVKKGKTNSYSHPAFRRGDWAGCSAMRSDNKSGHGLMSKQQLRLRQQSGAILNHQVSQTNSLRTSMTRIPSLPSLATLSTTSDSASVYTTNSNNHGLAPLGQHSYGHTFSGSIEAYPNNNHFFFGSEIASPTSPGMSSLLHQTQSSPLLKITGSTEEEILMNAYQTLHRSIQEDGCFDQF